MGTSSSRQERPADVNPCGRHTQLPEDSQPYQGPALEAVFTTVPVKLTSHFGAITSNVDDHYTMLAGYIEQGFTLNAFDIVPYAGTAGGITSTDVAYEAAFCRPVGEVPLSEHKVRLSVEKSTICIERFRKGILFLGSVTDSSDILNKIQHLSSTGVRLISIVRNGEVIAHGGMRHATGGTVFQLGKYGVDILFEVPAQPSQMRYVYQAINVPIGLTRGTGLSTKCTAHCNWLEILLSHLNQGWKLVEVFNDQSHQRASASSSEASMNAIWFFEKDASKLDDMTPIYEGAVVEYFHKISLGFRSVKVKTDWSAVIIEMGCRGWEFVCIQDTLEITRVGFQKVEVKLIMFFQRKIIGRPNVAPPPYPGLS